MSLIPGQRTARTRPASPAEPERAGRPSDPCPIDPHNLPTTLPSHPTTLPGPLSIPVPDLPLRDDQPRSGGLSTGLSAGLSADLPAGLSGDFDDQLVYRMLLAVDVQGYSRRDAREQLRTQQDLNALLDIAAESSGLDRGRWDKQVGGDGEMAVLPEGVNVIRAVEHFTRQLARALARLNRARQTADPHARPRLRLRLAFHHGTLTSGPFGPAGDAPIVVSRLLDSRALRRLLDEQPERDLAFIVSDTLFRDVVGTGFCGLEPTGFRQVRMMSKGLSHKGFMYVGRSMTATPADPAVPPAPRAGRPSHGADSGRVLSFPRSAS